MKPLQLEIRTPDGLAWSGPVDGLRAEDRDGWFGLRRGRSDLVASLVPGLLAFDTAEGERFVAHGGGMLDLEAGRCRVLLRQAPIAESLEGIADALARQLGARRHRAEARRGVLADLEREALRRLVTEGLP